MPTGRTSRYIWEPDPVHTRYEVWVPVTRPDGMTAGPQVSRKPGKVYGESKSDAGNIVLPDWVPIGLPIFFAGCILHWGMLYSV